MFDKKRIGVGFVIECALGAAVAHLIAEQLVMWWPALPYAVGWLAGALATATVAAVLQVWWERL